MPFYNYYQATGKQYNPQISSNSNASSNAGREGLKSRGYQNGGWNQNYSQKPNKNHGITPSERLVFRDNDSKQSKRAPNSSIPKSKPAYINIQQSAKPIPLGDFKNVKINRVKEGSNYPARYPTNNRKGEIHKNCNLLWFLNYAFYYFRFKTGSEAI